MNASRTVVPGAAWTWLNQEEGGLKQ